jgi:hypothetical protein
MVSQIGCPITEPSLAVPSASPICGVPRQRRLAAATGRNCHEIVKARQHAFEMPLISTNHQVDPWFGCIGPNQPIGNTQRTRGAINQVRVPLQVLSCPTSNPVPSLAIHSGHQMRPPLRRIVAFSTVQCWKSLYRLRRAQSPTIAIRCVGGQAHPTAASDCH